MDRSSQPSVVEFFRRRMMTESRDERGAMSNRQLAWLSAAGAAITAAGAIGSLWLANHLGEPASPAPTALAYRTRGAWVVDVSDVPELPFDLRIPVEAGAGVPNAVNVVVTGLAGTATCVTTSFAYPDGTSSVRSTYAVGDVENPRSAAPVPDCPPGATAARRTLRVQSEHVGR